MKKKVVYAVVGGYKLAVVVLWSIHTSILFEHQDYREKGDRCDSNSRSENKDNKSADNTVMSRGKWWWLGGSEGGVSHFFSDPASASMRMNVESNAVAIITSVAEHVMPPTLEGK
jgi:hypothetical protein